MHNFRVCSLVVLVTLTFACTENQAEREDFPYPVLADAVAGPGSDLLDGFIVEDGSWLLAAPFPWREASESDTESYGWTAFLALTDRPRIVTAAYLQQASDLGFTGSSRARCESDIHCSGDVYRQIGPERVTFAVEAVRGEAGLAGSETKIVIISLAGPLQPRANQGVSREVPSELRLPGGDLPSQGERFGGVQFEVDGRSVGDKVWLRLEKGSRLVVPPLLDPRDTLGPTLIALLRFDNDSRSVVSAYLEQLRDYYSGDLDMQTWELAGGFQAHRAIGYCPGGCGDYEISSIRWFDGATYGMIRASTRT